MNFKASFHFPFFFSPSFYYRIDSERARETDTHKRHSVHKVLPLGMFILAQTQTASCYSLMMLYKESDLLNDTDIKNSLREATIPCISFVASCGFSVNTLGLELT